MMSHSSTCTKLKQQAYKVGMAISRISRADSDSYENPQKKRIDPQILGFFADF